MKLKEGETVKTKNSDIIKQNNAFLYVAVGTLLLLLVPFTLMMFKIPLYDPGSGYEVLNWDLADFVIMGFLIFGIGSMFVLVSRVIPSKYRIHAGIGLFLLFLWIWAELAVGLFTNWGS